MGGVKLGDEGLHAAQNGFPDGLVGIETQVQVGLEQWALQPLLSGSQQSRRNYHLPRSEAGDGCVAEGGQAEDCRQELVAERCPVQTSNPMTERRVPDVDGLRAVAQNRGPTSSEPLAMTFSMISNIFSAYSVMISCKCRSESVHVLRRGA